MIKDSGKGRSKGVDKERRCEREEEWKEVCMRERK